MAGSKGRRPLWNMDTVCVPQTSIKARGRSSSLWSFSSRERHSAGSLKDFVKSMLTACFLRSIEDYNGVWMIMVIVKNGEGTFWGTMY